MQEKEISQAVIRRMPRYYRYLGELLDAGVERISSNDLSLRMNVTASQIRQDLNNFGGDVYKRQPYILSIWQIAFFVYLSCRGAWFLTSAVPVSVSYNQTV